jgi:hypothetical protein
MNHKDIRQQINRQLKKQYSGWNRLPKKQKREIARNTLAEVVADYDFNKPITASRAELLGIKQQLPTKGIVPLAEMAEFIKKIDQSRIIKFSRYKRSPLYIKDDELRFVDQIIDDTIINRLLAYDGYSPKMRDIFLSNMFRAELLKAIKYPEISYRKFCTDEYLGLDRKQNRVFTGLSLSKKDMIDHTELSKFRNGLTFTQQVNLLVYILYHFNQSGLLGNHILHGVDSTELANDCRMPLASLEINGRKIRIYNDLDCDCGKRRNKRDKSPYVVGYRLHTLTAIDAKTGHSFPLVSILAAANHHDSHFLTFLVNLAQAMGIDVKLVTADEAYHDKNGSLRADTGVIVTTPPSAKVSTPPNVDGKTGAVFCHDSCEIAMHRVGFDNQIHEYKCNAGPDMCQCQQGCSQNRFIPVDQGLFQQIPYATDQIKEAHAIRKNCERPFNLLKNQTGLENLRVRSQQAATARCTLSSIAVLLIKMAGLRVKKKTEKPEQLPLLKKTG